jgi:hypothetical protein
MFVMQTNLMHHYFSSIYFVKKPLHVSGVFIAHHQEVFTVYVQQLVRVVHSGDWQLAGSGWNSNIYAPAGFEPTIPASERPQTHN